MVLDSFLQYLKKLQEMSHSLKIEIFLQIHSLAAVSD